MRRAILLLLVALSACGGSSKPSTAPLTTNGATVATFSGKDSGAFCPIVGPFVHATDLQAVFTDAEAAKARVAELRPVIAEARRKAPPEIKADVERVADRVTQGFDALAAANYQALKIDRATIDALLGDEQFKASAARIGEYAQQVCRVSP
jgi:hypothetical protein